VHTWYGTSHPEVSKSPKASEGSWRELLERGVQQVRVVLRALALLQLANGVSAPRIASVVPLTPQADSKDRPIATSVKASNLRSMKSKRPGATPLLEDNQRQRIIAMVCSDPPEGRARWTVRLVAEEAVKRDWFQR